MTRKLATIRRISKIEPIKGKDRVELATVDGWTCMVSKADNFKAGDRCVFCEPDSVFPQTEQWEFLKKYNYRIKTQRFKDGDGNYIYSQGLVLPMTIPQLNGKCLDGQDVTDLIGITQYEPTMDIDGAARRKPRYPRWIMRIGFLRKMLLSKNQVREFPDFVSKTDEERIQNCPDILKHNDEWVATEKIDGQSGTFAVRRRKSLFFTRYDYWVCSRNFARPVPDNSSYWKVERRYHIKEKLVSYMKDHPEMDFIVIQGECIAPDVQKNKYDVKEADMYVFNFIVSPAGMKTPMRLGSYRAREIVENVMGMKFVPILGVYQLDELDVNGVLELANGESRIHDTLREGIVFRSYDGRKSFKAVSPEFLVKYGE